MTGRWFRLYEEVVDDPKVQRLPPALFKTWINLLCAASRFGGQLKLVDLPFILRRDEKKVGEDVGDLLDAQLFEEHDGVLTPHNWVGRQFRSDHSTERVKRFRDRSRNGEGNGGGNADETDEKRQRNGASNGEASVPETPSETPPETEQSQNQSRTEAEKKENYPKPLKERKAYEKDQVWVVRGEPDWARYAAAYLAEKGKNPPAKPGLGGMGWYFPRLPEGQS